MWPRSASLPYVSGIDADLGHVAVHGIHGIAPVEVDVGNYRHGTQFNHLAELIMLFDIGIGKTDDIAAHGLEYGHAGLKVFLELRKRNIIHRLDADR